MCRTIFLLPWPNFTGFYDSHLPTPYLKSVFREVWQKESSILRRTSKSKFRSYGTVNPYLFRYWQLVTGQFSPINPSKKAIYLELRDSNKELIMSIIRKQKIDYCIE